jgi:hypothetical protein
MPLPLPPLFPVSLRLGKEKRREHIDRSKGIIIANRKTKQRKSQLIVQRANTRIKEMPHIADGRRTSINQ